MLRPLPPPTQRMRSDDRTIFISKHTSTIASRRFNHTASSHSHAMIDSKSKACEYPRSTELIAILHRNTANTALRRPRGSKASQDSKQTKLGRRFCTEHTIFGWQLLIRILVLLDRFCLGHVLERRAVRWPGVQINAFQLAVDMFVTQASVRQPSWHLDTLDRIDPIFG